MGYGNDDTSALIRLLTKFSKKLASNDLSSNELILHFYHHDHQLNSSLIKLDYQILNIHVTLEHI